MERLTNANHKEIGFYSYCGPQNPFETPLTIGEISGFITDYNPRKILEDILARLAAYEDTGLMPEEIDALQKREQGLTELLVNISCRCTVTYTRLAELAQADKDGRIWLLAVVPQGRPGGRGNRVYVIENGEIYDDYVVGVHIGVSSNGELRCLYEAYEGSDFYSADIGKTVFLTREEAEEALKKREDMK